MRVFICLAIATFSFCAMIVTSAVAQEPVVSENQVSRVGKLGLTEDELFGVASQAYMFGLPPTEIARLRSVPMFSGNATREANRNSFAHLRAIMPAGTGICCPNQDTLYSLSWIDVSEAPVILSIPPMGERYFVAHVTDIYTRNRPALSRRTVGVEGGKYLITGPTWQGEVPEGIQHYPLVTNEGLVLLRIAPLGDDDIPAVNALQDQVTLSHPDGIAISDARYRAHNPDDPFEVFKQLDEVIRNNPATGRDSGLVKTLSSMGLGGVEAFNPNNLAPWEREIILKSKATTHAMLTRHLPNVGELRNGWFFLVPGDQFQNDHLARATIALSYILPNDALEALYPIGTVDSEEQQLNSAFSYRIHFSGKVPAGAFWSLIAYDFPAVRLIENGYGKYAVSDRTAELALNEDGSLDLYLASQPVPGTPESNWLPVPEGDFSVVLRLYEPAPEVADGRWSPPAIERLEN